MSSEVKKTLFQLLLMKVEIVYYTVVANYFLRQRSISLLSHMMCTFYRKPHPLPAGKGVVSSKTGPIRLALCSMLNATY